MDDVTVGIFTPSVLLEVARTTGRLTAANLKVHDVAVASSPAQFSSLRDGEYDAVFTSPDNALAYRFLSGNPLGELLDVEVVAALDRGVGLCLGVRPGVREPAELRGGRLGVDVAHSGFAFVAYALLEQLGLTRDDYEVVTLGSTPRRAVALAAGGCDVTVLNAGNELTARTQGCTLLAEVTRLGPYIGTVVARMRTAAGRGEVDRLVAVLLATARDIQSAASDDATRAAATRVLGLGAGAAAEHLAVLRDPSRGLIPGGAVDAASLHTLLELRRRFRNSHEIDSVPNQFDTLVRAGALVG